MKKLFSLIALALFIGSQSLLAQSASLDLPTYTLIPHYRLFISFNTTTVLVFAAPVKPVDRGTRDIIAQKQPGVENVLKLKAARKNFDETNLHVFTADGRFYAFDVTYSDSLATTRDLTPLAAAQGRLTGVPQILLSDEPINTAEMASIVRTLDSLPRARIATQRDQHMQLRLTKVGLSHNLLFFRFSITNRSNLDYPLDFFRLYIKDVERAKRSSAQEQEVTPVFEDSTTVIRGHSSAVHVIAVPAFSLPSGKQFVVEAYEKNGGRSLTLRLKNGQLFRAVKL